MIRHFISTLKQKELLTPTGLVFALIVVLSLIIILGQFFHQSLQSEMAEQFNKQQLLLSREVAMNIESYTDHVFKTIRAISQLPQIEQINENSKVRYAVDSITSSLRNEALITIRVLDQNGIIRYDSTYPRRVQTDLSKTDYFNRARVLPQNEKLITDLLETHDSGEDTKQFIIAVPVYTRKENRSLQEFNGVVLAALSMNGLTSRFLAPIKSGRRGYAWMMDSDGTLLYHPTQPQMVGKNL